MKPVALNSEDDDSNRSSLIRINITTSLCMKPSQSRTTCIKNVSYYEDMFFFLEFFHSCLWTEYQITARGGA
jgi:hypothetical protein